MNIDFFGIPYSFGLPQRAVYFIYEFLGVSTEESIVLNSAGLVTRLIRAGRDKTWGSRFGIPNSCLFIGAIIYTVLIQQLQPLNRTLKYTSLNLN